MATGAAMVASSLAFFAPAVVDAQGPSSIFGIFTPSNDSGENSAPPTPVPDAPSSVDSGRPSGKETRRIAGHPVCVRLCDGAFFPIEPGSKTSTNSAAICGGLCPDAETAVYMEPSDKIEDAVSLQGAAYTALPGALRYRTNLDPACVCHRQAAHRYPILRDPTLRKGDYVMTASGFVVFDGSARPPFTRSDFTTVALARVPAEQRAELRAIEAANLRSGEGRGDRSLMASRPDRSAASGRAASVKAPQRTERGAVRVANQIPPR